MTRIAIEHPDQPEVLRLIADLDAFQKPLYPAESHHGIDMAALSQPNVVFVVARDDGARAVGCGAIVVNGEWAELKRMYVQPSHRGSGIARAVLARLEAEAQARGVRDMMLETGPLQPEALGLYDRAGYKPCGPFGDYGPDPHSVFMRKPLAIEAAAQHAGR